MRLSVVLCTCQGAAFLDEQLQSLLRQERLPDEVVIADDASTDRTPALLEAFAHRAAGMGVRVQVHRNATRLGVAGNFSQALERASGDLLFLCDQDDVWSSAKLRIMEARFMEDPSLLLLGSDARLVDRHGQALGHSLFEALELGRGERALLHGGRAFDVLLRRSMVTGATAAFRRTLLASALPVGAGWVHDEWLAIVASTLGKVDALEAALIDYRQHGGNQIGMRKRGLLDKTRDMVVDRRRQMEYESQRLQLLERHLRSLGEESVDRAIAAVAAKRAHFERRVGIGRMRRAQRLGPVWREWAGGHYARYGTGWRSALRDVVRRG